MAHDKLNESDEGFIDLPSGAVQVSAGVNGTESFLERDTTATVRLVISTVAVAAAGGSTLDAVIEVDGETARAQDGPINSDHHQHLQAVQSVQVVVKEGERVRFKAYPQAQGARVLRTVVYTSDIRPPSKGD